MKRSNSCIIKVTTTIACHHSILVLAVSLILGLNALGQRIPSGTYTIGGSNPDYQTISAAMDNLNQRGTHGDSSLTFLVREGVYHEKIYLNYIRKGQDTFRLTIKADPGNSGSVILNDSLLTDTDPFIELGYDTRNVEVSGLTLKSVKTFPFLTGIEVHGIGHRISNCIIGGKESSNKFRYGIDYSGQDGVTVRSTRIENADYGIYVQDIGNSLFEIIDCEIVGWRKYGVSTLRTGKVVLENNTIISADSAGFDVESNGVKIDNSGSIILNRNLIQVEGQRLGVTGINLSDINSFGSSAIDNTITNNVIVLPGLPPSGVTFSQFALTAGYAYNLKIYHNSFYTNIPAENQVWEGSVSIGDTGCVFKNNVVLNNNTGNPFHFYKPVIESNNCFYSSDKKPTVSLATSDLWEDPQFSDNSKLVPSSESPLNDNGVFVSVGADKNGIVRSFDTPDIGAYEFNGSNAASVSDIISKDQIVTVFPNPTSGSVNVHFIQEKGKSYRLEVLDISGAKIHEKFVGSIGQTITLDLGANNGVYILRVIESGVTVSSKKLVKL